ncbi:hypothetical protein A6P39_037140 [Streptomyces sp. FXJ1.172]|uniref:hypothetical protein n=1 Tax=Streptomyces sp. FXJ1.172 TaxID=710705 RepID=UPI0007D02C19|nr:hypothetical protein [Streptomyces sp. FXJ1.172]WEO99214.1 hypothetical protein A6P39_037140 [Streptomyces sp. FXJ1.172]
MPGEPAVVRVSVSDRGARACGVDRVTAVTFGGPDGSALPVPADGTGGYRLAADRTAQVDVRAIGLS